MQSAWRQGSLISPEDAVRLGIIPPDGSSTARVLVISHSCDIATNAELEPSVEVLIGTQVEPDVGDRFLNGHSIRKVSIKHNTPDGHGELGLYSILSRTSVPKSDLESIRPWTQVSVERSELNVLRRWLAQRYSRAEFPDKFVEWLEERRIEERVEKVAKKFSKSIRAIFFDLDDDSERTDPDLPYKLAIYLVYHADNEQAKTDAEAARDSITQQFKTRCLVDGKWRWIELIACDAISDESFSLFAADEFRRWRLEHRSLAGEPAVEPE